MQLQGQRIPPQISERTRKAYNSTTQWQSCKYFARHVGLWVTLIRHCTRQEMHVQRNIEARSSNHCCRGKAVSITYLCALCANVGMCMHVHVALLIQHANHIRRVMTSFVAPLAPSPFSSLSHKSHDFRENVTENKTCVLIFCTTFSKIFLILRRI
jgi:hypothetical protein